MPPRRSMLAVLIAMFSLALAACGGDEATVGDDDQAEVGSGAGEEAGHIHGLGVDEDDTLFIATHNGLFAAPKGQATAERVSESTQDFMGFDMATEDRFIGSGHPALDQDLPPLLGLIESRDGGRTWENVSLLGEADFHVLESGGDRVYGFDGTQGRLMVSSDGGRNWKQEAPPAGVYDVAIDPQDIDRVIASTERGVFVSNDAGKRWRPLNDELAGLLAWPAADRLFLVDGQGQILRSDDGGGRFRPIGQAGGQPVAFMVDEDDLYVALADGSVQRSDDGGAGWTLRATP